MVKRLIILLALTSFYMLAVKGQSLNKSIDKDSLFRVVINRLPESAREEYSNTYKESTERIKEYFLFMLSMPLSSKKELIENYEKNKSQIICLKEEFNKLVPENYNVMIEFNPKDVIWNIKESIDFKIYKKGTTGKFNLIFQEWNLGYDSPELKEQINKIGWDNATITKIKDLLSYANCVSIENGDTANIGFARSGMGKYYYEIFDSNLTNEEISKHNNGCTSIYYKDNVVLKYAGGAIGPQCFPD